MPATVPASATDLVAYVNTLLELSASPLDLSVEIKKNDTAAVVAAIAPKAEQLLAHDAETDVEGTFNMLFDVIRQLPQADAVAQATKVLATVLAKQDEKAVLRLRIATNLFNKSAALPELRFDALVHVIAFASKTENLDLVASYFDDVEALFAAQTLSAQNRRKLFLTIADALQSVPETYTSLKVLLFLEKYLSTFAAGDKDLATGKDVALRATKIVLQQPVASFVARVDLISSPVVTSTLKGEKLFELLDIVSNKTLSEYTAFQKAVGAAFFKDNKLDAQDLEATLRLFTLCTFPASFDEVSFATIASKLAIQEDEVEAWVVKAITSHLVSAKVDQLKRTVVISRTLQRGFGAAQWADVDAKLQLYKKNVGALLDVVRSARQAHQQNAARRERKRKALGVHGALDELQQRSLDEEFASLLILKSMGKSPRKASVANCDDAAMADCATSSDVLLQRQPSALQVDSMITLSIDMNLHDVLDGEAGDVSKKLEPDADSVFSTAAHCLLEGLMAAILLSSCSPHVNQDGGDLQFPLDREALAQDKDKHGASLSVKKKKQSASKVMAHMGKQNAARNSRSPSLVSSRASSRAASRFGGSATASVLSLRHSVLAMKLTKLSFHPSSLSKPSDPFHIVPWDEVGNSSEVESQTSSHGNKKTADRWGNTTTSEYSARGTLNTASNTTSRVPFDFHEAQRRQEISNDIDNRETRQRIAREVRRKGDLKLKLRSLADPTVSLEREELLAGLAKKMSSRGGFQLDTRGSDSGIAVSTPATGNRISTSVSQAGSTANMIIPENNTFRKEDYDGLRSDVVMLDRNGELLVGENCFLVAKKSRQELLQDLFRKSMVEPRVQLPSNLQESLGEAIATGGESSPSLERQQPYKSPDRPSISRSSPGRQVPSLAVQDAIFDGQRGSFESFPKLELDPEKTPLTKGVTLKVDEEVKRKALVTLQALSPLTKDASLSLSSPTASQQKAKLTKPTHASATVTTDIQETRSNDPLENQLKTMMLQSKQKMDLHRKPSSHQLTSRLDTGEDQQLPSPEQRKPGDYRPQSKHHNQRISQKASRTTRTPAVRDRISRKALLKPEFSEFDDDLESTEQEQLYSLHESGGPTSLPKVKLYQREFPSPPRGHVKVVSAAKVSELMASPRSLPFPFTTLPTVLKAKR